MSTPFNLLTSRVAPPITHTAVAAAPLPPETTADTVILPSDQNAHLNGKVGKVAADATAIVAALIDLSHWKGSENGVVKYTLGRAEVDTDTTAASLTAITAGDERPALAEILPRDTNARVGKRAKKVAAAADIPFGGIKRKAHTEPDGDDAPAPGKADTSTTEASLPSRALAKRAKAKDAPLETAAQAAPKSSAKACISTLDSSHASPPETTVSVYERRLKAATTQKRIKFVFKGVLVRRAIIYKNGPIATARVKPANPHLHLQKLPTVLLCNIMQFLIPNVLYGDMMANLELHIGRDIWHKRTLPYALPSIGHVLFNNKITKQNYLLKSIREALNYYLHGTYPLPSKRYCDRVTIPPEKVQLMRLDLSILPLRAVSKTFQRILTTQQPFNQLLAITAEHIRNAKWKHIIEIALNSKEIYTWLTFTLSERSAVSMQLLREFVNFLVKQSPSAFSTKALDHLFLNDDAVFKAFSYKENYFTKKKADIIYSAIVNNYWKRNPDTWDRYNNVLLNNGTYDENHAVWLIDKLCKEKKGKNRERCEALLNQFFALTQTDRKAVTEADSKEEAAVDKVHFVHQLIAAGQLDAIQKLHQNFKAILEKHISGTDLRSAIQLMKVPKVKKKTKEIEKTKPDPAELLKAVDECYLFLLKKGLLKFRTDETHFHHLLASHHLPKTLQHYNRSRKTVGLPEVEAIDVAPASRRLSAAAAAAPAKKDAKTKAAGKNRRLSAAAAAAEPAKDARTKMEAQIWSRPTQVNAGNLEECLELRDDADWVDLFKKIFHSKHLDAVLIGKMIKHVESQRPQLINHLFTPDLVFCHQTPFKPKVANYLYEYIMENSITEKGNIINSNYEAILNHGYYNREHLTWLLQEIEHCTYKIQNLLLNRYFELSTSWIGLRAPHNNLTINVVHQLVMFGDITNLQTLHEEFPELLNDYIHNRAKVSLVVQVKDKVIQSDGLRIIIDNIVTEPGEVDEVLLFLVNHYKLFNVNPADVADMGPAAFVEAIEATPLVAQLKSGRFPLTFNRYRDLLNGQHLEALWLIAQRKQAASPSVATIAPHIQTPGSAWGHLDPSKLRSTPLPRKR